MTCHSKFGVTDLLALLIFPVLDYLVTQEQLTANVGELRITRSDWLRLEGTSGYLVTSPW